jgi:hypothetical protein
LREHYHSVDPVAHGSLEHPQQLPDVKLTESIENIETEQCLLSISDVLNPRPYPRLKRSLDTDYEATGQLRKKLRFHEAPSSNTAFKDYSMLANNLNSPEHNFVIHSRYIGAKNSQLTIEAPPFSEISTSKLPKDRKKEWFKRLEGFPFPTLRKDDVKPVALDQTLYVPFLDLLLALRYLRSVNDYPHCKEHL